LEWKVFEMNLQHVVQVIKIRDVNSEVSIDQLNDKGFKKVMYIHSSLVLGEGL